MKIIDSANNWPGFSELLCEVKGASTTWSSCVKDVVLGTLREQYSSLGLELPKGFECIESPKVTTVTTGHQLQLFGGAAFLHYKTITTIRKARELSSEESPVIPVFWMASEDHDFEEISWVYGKKSKHNWIKDSGSNMVGKLSLDGLLEAFESWSSDCVINHVEILEILRLSINQGECYSDFFIRLMHLWYGDTGLVVIDASHKNLKELFAMEMSSELKGEGIAPNVLPGNVKPRDINLFHAPTEGPRVGVVPSDNGPVSNGERISGESPVELSPSVLLRPLYQEKILPNSHVILGPSEIKYWQQLVPVFEKLKINMPTLYLRDHVLVIKKKDLDVLERLGWSVDKGWWSKDDFVRIIMDKGLESRFDLKLEDLHDDENLLGILREFNIEFGSELKYKDPASRVKNKIRKTAIKKVKRHLKEILREEINALYLSLSKVMNGRIPQDRWVNFHVLSRSVGGFENLRDKLLETTEAEGPVMQVIVAD